MILVIQVYVKSVLLGITKMATTVKDVVLIAKYAAQVHVPNVHEALFFKPVELARDVRDSVDNARLMLQPTVPAAKEDLTSMQTQRNVLKIVPKIASNAIRMEFVSNQPKDMH